MPEGGEYVEWQVDGRTVAGATTMGSDVPRQVPSYWLVYFAVADCDATVSRAQELGGRVMVPCMDIPQGRFAILTDPQGGTFGVIRL
jgi:predicted enzyme related to lactoylglutathione lyase